MKASTICLFSMLMLGNVGHTQGDEITGLSQMIPAAINKINPSLVTVQVYGGTRISSAPQKKGKKAPRRRGFPVARGATTGVVASADGYILTSLWSFQLAPTAIIVTLADGKKFTATPRGHDYARGVALLKIKASGLTVPQPAPRYSIRPGAWVLATGRTFGPKIPASSLGIISAVNRLGGRALQTDAAVSPSCYGGALIDLQGRIQGILAPLSPRGYAAGIKWYDSGIGFAATWKGVQQILPRLQKGEDLFPGQLGVATSPADLGPGALIPAPKKSRRPGPTPATVKDPAKAAGLLVGDRITKIAGTLVRHPFHLKSLLASYYAGDEIEVVVKRGDKHKTFKVKLARRSMTPPLPRQPLNKFLPPRRQNPK